MTAVLDELGLRELVTSIDGLSAVGAAVILAETGDLTRFASARSVVKHAELNPSEHTSATLAGKTRISRRGWPGLRAAAWRAVWGGMRHNRVLHARHAHLTGRRRATGSATRRPEPRARRPCCAGCMPSSPGARCGPRARPVPSPPARAPDQPQAA